MAVVSGRRFAASIPIELLVYLSFVLWCCQAFHHHFQHHPSRLSVRDETRRDYEGFSVLRRIDDRPFVRSTSFRTSLPASSSSYGNDSFADAMRRNDARTDIRNLLTQRSIQSFMFLLTECRDPHSCKWIEEFLNTKNLLQYHGTGAGFMERFGGTWDAPIHHMMEQPKDVVIVSAKRRGRGHGGWSKENPYLEERFVEFEIDIDPVSLSSRIVSVREQIAAEWVNDLSIILEANDQILESYFARMKQQREERMGDDYAAVDQEVAFDRTAAIILNNRTCFQSGGTSSPFRKGNFDLLYNLCTQASVHRLLRQYQDEGDTRQVAFTWLRDFYIGRVEEYFDGDQPYGRADDFIEDLLLSPVSVMNDKNGQVLGIADPLGSVEQIIAARSEVVKEWQELMRNVPVDHTGLRKLLLGIQMKAWGSGGVSSSDSSGSSDTSQSGSGGVLSQSDSGEGFQ